MLGLNSDHSVAAETSKDISGSAKDGMEPVSEAASEVAEHPGRPTGVDVSYDDVLARTTHKSDGR